MARCILLIHVGRRIYHYELVLKWCTRFETTTLSLSVNMLPQNLQTCPSLMCSSVREDLLQCACVLVCSREREIAIEDGATNVLVVSSVSERRHSLCGAENKYSTRDSWLCFMSFAYYYRWIQIMYTSCRHDIDYLHAVLLSALWLVMSPDVCLWLCSYSV